MATPSTARQDPGPWGSHAEPQGWSACLGRPRGLSGLGRSTWGPLWQWGEGTYKVPVAGWVGAQGLPPHLSGWAEAMDSDQRDGLW